MGKPTPKQTWIGLALAVLTAATSYLGYDKYEQSQIIVQPSEVNVAITSLPSSATRSDSDIKTMIEAAIKDHVENSGRH